MLDNSAPTMANNPEFVPSNIAMNYETNTAVGSSEYYPNIYGDDDMSGSIAALQGHIDNLVSNAHDIIPKLRGAKIVNAKFNLFDVEGTNGTSKRCYI